MNAIAILIIFCFYTTTQYTELNSIEQAVRKLLELQERQQRHLGNAPNILYFTQPNIHEDVAPFWSNLAPQFLKSKFHREKTATMMCTTVHCPGSDIFEYPLNPIGRVNKAMTLKPRPRPVLKTKTLGITEKRFKKLSSQTERSKEIHLTLFPENEKTNSDDDRPPPFALPTAGNDMQFGPHIPGNVDAGSVIGKVEVTYRSLNNSKAHVGSWYIRSESHLEAPDMSEMNFGQEETRNPEESDEDDTPPDTVSRLRSKIPNRINLGSFQLMVRGESSPMVYNLVAERQNSSPNYFHLPPPFTAA